MTIFNKLGMACCEVLLRSGLAKSPQLVGTCRGAYPGENVLDRYLVATLEGMSGSIKEGYQEDTSMAYAKTT